ncbi:MAG: sulfatase-like hydrolase/transferase, partial [Phycisphaerales bacterium]|nr:sulfatase-like hydrolase/transferase [Phycisphaerales bacterium]
PPRTMRMPPFERMYGMFDFAPLDVPNDDMGDFQSVEYVLDQKRRPREQPFFLACGIYRPHLPWYVPRRYFDMFPLDEITLPVILENDLDDLPDRALDFVRRGGDYHRHVVEADQWRPAVQGYLASIAFADAMLGRLLDGLEESGHADDTIVVLWSDHGWQLGEKSHWRKFALWENVARSVLMIRAPDSSPGLPDGSDDGTPCHRVVSLQDIYPTLPDLCGLPAREDIDGRSLVPLLRDPDTPWDHVALTTYDHGEFSVRDERFRYIRYIDGSEELYDHDTDDEEWHNLASNPDYDDQRCRLAAQIPDSIAPLVPTSQRLQLHHVPPLRSRADDDEWIANGRDDAHLIRKYWQGDPRTPDR